MFRFKKAGILIISIIVVIAILNFCLSFWIEKKLPQLINSEKNSEYYLTYKDVDLSIWNSFIRIYEIKIVPKNSKESKKIGVFASVNEIEVTNFSIISILFSDKIKARKLTIHKPDIILYKDNSKVISNPKSIRNKIVQPFEKVIVVSNIILKRGNLKIFYENGNEDLAEFKNLNLELDGIVINEKSLQKSIPFEYENFNISCSSALFKPNEFYTLQTKKIKVTPEDFKIEEFKLLPTHSRGEFIQKIPFEKDLYTILAAKIDLKNTDWGFNDSDDFYFNCDSIVLNELDANIYRSKVPNDDNSKKKLYNELLRELPIDLSIKTINLKDSKLVYEEQLNINDLPGKLYFDDMNASIDLITSGRKVNQVKDTEIKVNCTFMQESKLNVTWKFNVLDKTEGFKIKGKLLNFSAEKMDYFTKPYLNVNFKGDLEEVYFDFKGNDYKNSGNFALKYDDLKLTVFRNNKPHKKNKFLTTVGNLFLKNDSNEKLKTVAVNVERNQEKSFYNYLWISVAEGLKKILL